MTGSEGKTSRFRGRRLSLERYKEGVLAGDRGVLARAITLVESTLGEDRRLARRLIFEIIPHRNVMATAQRVGISGVPGVGKSTFIESFGMHVVRRGHRVAVLTVDPSSSRTGGSILGDKTRMAELACSASAFIRPSPAAGSLGGVARNTREAMLLCEAAGYDVIVVETVGVGQSETVVAEMVDFFLVLMLAGAGDELQGIKRGILELADLLAVNKADGENRMAATRARSQIQNALHLMHPRSEAWVVPVMTCSAQTESGIAEIWLKIGDHRRLMQESGEWQSRREEQRIQCMWRMIEESLLERFCGQEEVKATIAGVEAMVRNGTIGPEEGMDRLLGEEGRSWDLGIQVPQ